MNRKVFIIHPDEIKSESRIEITADDKTLRELISVTQDVKLNAILGETLYNTVTDAIYQYVQSNVTISTAIQNLLPYVKKYLLFQVTADFIYVNHYKLTNKGTMRLNDSNAQSATNTDIEWYRSYYDNATAAYKKRLVDYLATTTLVQDVKVDDDYSFRGVYMDIDDCTSPNSIKITSDGSVYKMTTLARLDITEEGALVYDTDLHRLYCYDGSQWQPLW